MQRAHRELVAVVVTGGLHLFFEEVLHAKAAFIGIAFAGWTAYLAWAVRRDPGSLTDWGLTGRGLRPTLPVAGAVLGLGAAALATAGFALGHLRVHWPMAPLLLLYPIWGVAQQFMVQSIIARNLDRIGLPAYGTVLVTALSFGLVHWPDRFLMAATCVLALVFTPIYLRHRNVWPLGIVHGWLGVLAYYWLLGRDPWAELFG